MKDYIFMGCVLIVILIAAIILIALASIPIYIGTYIRCRRLSNVAREFNLAYSKKFPSFWEFISPFTGKMIIMFIEGKVNNHQVSIKEISGEKWSIFKRRYSLIEIDGKNFHDTLLKQLIFNISFTTSVFKIRQILSGLGQDTNMKQPNAKIQHR